MPAISSTATRSCVQVPASIVGPLSFSKASLLRFDRSDQKNQISRTATVSPRGCRVKRDSVVSLYDVQRSGRGCLAASTQPNLLSFMRRMFRIVSAITRAPQVNGGARRDRTDDILLAKQALSQLSYGPIKGATSQKGMVGPGRLELPTSRLSGVRSNHLSYGPLWTRQKSQARSGLRTLTREYVACEERETKAAKFRMFRAALTS